jgi:hypothetical protein
MHTWNLILTQFRYLQDLIIGVYGAIFIDRYGDKYGDRES